MSDKTTLSVRAGIDRDPAFRGVTPPVCLSATFSYETLSERGDYYYGRTHNPTRDLLAEAIAELEGAAGAVITASGMAAIDLLLHDLPAGAVVVAPHDCYGGTRRLLDARAAPERLQVRYADQLDLAAVRNTADGAALILAETPSNPLLRVADIAALAEIAKAAGAELAVDNTVLSPLGQSPLSLGADIVVHSTTKLVNGHSDSIAGAVAARDPARGERLAWWANCAGVSGAPFDSWLTLRGLRTLPVRFERQCANALALARFLETHEAVEAVHYPGLESHADHALALKQQAAGGCLLSFTLKGGAEGAARTANSLALFIRAQSLGAVESLVCQPASMTHAAMSAGARAEAGFDESLLRLSTGLESEDALIADLAQALDGRA